LGAKPQLRPDSSHSAKGPQIEQRTPKTAFISEQLPGRKIIEFSLEFKGNVPGDVSRIAAALTEHNVNILTGFHDAARWGFFADLTDVKIPLEKLIHEIELLPVTKSIKVHSGAPEDLVIDALHYPLLWGEKRLIYIRAEVMSAVLGRLRDIFGREGPAGRAMLFTKGEAAGRTGYTNIARRVGGEVFKKQVYDLLDLYTASGWGIFKIQELDIDKKTARVRVFDSFECAVYKGSESSPRSEFVRGDLVGLFSEVFSVRVDAVETDCIASGNACCEFSIKPKTVSEIV
jgi:predicted hydrocarbon binding protein